MVCLIILAGAMGLYLKQPTAPTKTPVVSRSTESSPGTSDGAWYRGAVLRIGSTVIEDPEVLDAARRFIKSRLLSPLKPAKGGEDGTSWLVG